ncbi:pyrroline-5-carboxylate reductase dimerization-domain-containing protein [Staphylotrichum tortipilum]|uniref:Pyrroline-5-carboxylate reductase dimerization-domain-containing protein n=1 Tax=Staphylotrichum tortipilum TaxID=2831512 RepID=A0AAN6RV24_9PEZI|nr:pyrroline-5-carboxylate reductase dimerization-domain-containing protein [Staphylotrichum longicolle]
MTTAGALSSGGFTLAIVGCGKRGFIEHRGLTWKLGTAVLQGLLVSPAPAQESQHTLQRILVSVRVREKGQRVLDKVLGDSNPHDRPCLVELVVGDNAEAARRADVVVLACHPHQGREVLGVPGMPEALGGKLLVSMLGGVSVTALEDSLYWAKSAGRAVTGPGRCHIVQAIPNVAAARGSSTTVVGERSDSIPDEVLERGHEVLRRIGQSVFVGRDEMPAATALCASGTALFVWFLGAMVDASVAEGIDKDEATRMAALTMAGAAGLVASGETPGAVIAKVTTPGGATARGLIVLEQSTAKEAIAEALRAITSKIRS